MVNQRSMDLIKAFEGLYLKAYQGAADKQGIITIGWGHVITGHESHTHGVELFKPGQLITEVQITEEIAEKLLRKDLEIAQLTGFLVQVPKNIRDILTDDQKGALTSLVFNIGSGNFRRSKILELLKQASTDEEGRDALVKLAGHAFSSWVSSAGKRRRGLARRRAAEKALYLGDYQLMEEFMKSASAPVIKKAAQYLGVEYASLS